MSKSEGINKYYIASVKFLQLEETTTGKLKYKSQRHDYLVNAASIPSADKTLHALLGGVYDAFEIISIRLSSIIAVLDLIKSM